MSIYLSPPSSRSILVPRSSAGQKLFRFLIDNFRGENKEFSSKSQISRAFKHGNQVIQVDGNLVKTGQETMRLAEGQTVTVLRTILDVEKDINCQANERVKIMFMDEHMAVLFKVGYPGETFGETTCILTKFFKSACWSHGKWSNFKDSGISSSASSFNQ